MKSYTRLLSMALLLIFQNGFAQNPIFLAHNSMPSNKPNYIFDSLNTSQINIFDLNILRKKPQYGLVDEYKEGFSRILKNQVYGFINEKGEEIITPQYDFAHHFNQGKALVKKFNWFFINQKGEESEVLKGIIDAKPIIEGFSLVKLENGKMMLIDNNFDYSKKPISKEYNEILQLNNNTFIAQNDKKFGLLTFSGQEKLGLEYDKILKITESDDWLIIEKHKKQGLVDISGEAFIKPIFDKIETFSMISVGEKTFLNLLAQNEKGFVLIEITNRLISNTYQKIEDFNQFALSKVMLKTDSENYGYIDFTGKEIITPTHFEIGKFSKHGFVIANNKAKESKLYDYRGNLVLDEVKHTHFAHTDTLFASNLVAIQVIENGNPVKFHLIDRKLMKPITAEPYTRIGKFGNYLTFQKDEKWGLMEKTGNQILKPIYEQFLFESEELLGVKYENQKFGFIDLKGKIKVGFDYDEVNPFENGLAIVSKGNHKIGVINHLNAKIIPLVFNKIERENNHFVVRNSDEKFVIDFEGNCRENCNKYTDIVRKMNQK